jgi:hypothetical protein
MNSETGKYIVIIGVITVVTGLIVWFFHDRLGWIGRLPGDVRVEKENFRFYFPIVTMILFSVGVTLIAWIIKKIF